jgi:hypothetical protein
MKRAIAAIFTLVLVSVVAAQQWEIERVDSAGWGAGLQMQRHPDGRLYLCYEKSATGRIRLAWEGDTWHYEDVPEPTPAGDGEPRFAFAADGTIGVTYTSQPTSWLSRKVDSTWLHTSLPGDPLFDWWTTPVTFDSAGRPVLAVVFDPDSSGGWVKALGLLRLTDTTWDLTDTLDLAPHGPVYNVVGFGTRTSGDLWGTYTTYVYDIGYIYMDIRWFRWQGGWEFGTFFGGERASITGAGGAVDRNGTVHASFNGYDTTQSGFFYDVTAVSGERPERSGLVFDTADRPFIAYAVDSVLKFCYRDTHGWHFFDVGVGGVAWLDVLAEPDGEPVIAYATPDGLFLARGVSITGVDELQQPGFRRPTPTATIIRGVLFLPASHFSLHFSLFDMTGRQVMTLRPGPNDVSRLVPGVYFVSQRRTMNEEPKTIKIVIQD